ncbi:MAG: hypothetical protein RLZZ592_2950, partial [Pseudomonadota bacterium]
MILSPTPAFTGNEPVPRILAVDDDPVFRRSIAFALDGYRFQGREVELLQAGSVAEARAQLERHPDIGVILLDVVMEQDDAGLQLVRQVRGDLDRQDVRIILLTGQPGLAPMHDVMRDLDVDEYWHKTELGSERLEALLNANLRSHQSIMREQQGRRRFERLLQAVDRANRIQDLTGLARQLLDDVAALLEAEPAGLVAMWPPHTTGPLVIGAAGAQTELQGMTLVSGARLAGATPHLTARIEHALGAPAPTTTPEEDEGPELLLALHPGPTPRSVLRGQADTAQQTLFALWVPRPCEPDATERELVRLLAANVGAQMHRLDLIAQLDRIAYQDELTGLPNRNGLLRRMHAAGERLSTMVLQFEDVDQFSNLNLMLGFETANRLLQALAERLREEAGPDVMVARVDNDTFALLGPADQMVAQMYRDRTEGITVSDGHFSAVLHLTGAQVDLSLVTGPPEETLATARYLLNDAKRHGWGQQVCYRPGMETQARDNYRLGQALHEALRAGEIRIALQPQVWLQDGSLKGFEALARWTDRRGR